MKFNKNKVICIKARSHSDFELYLISEKYDIPYDFLMGYKKDIDVYKFWTEIGSGIILATESRTDGKKMWTSYPMTINETDTLISIKPIKSPKIKDEHEESEKIKEFKIMLKEKEDYRQKMLNRKYDINNIICINLKLPESQLFAICQHYNIDFLSVMDYKDNVYVNKVWFEKDTSIFVAYYSIYNNQQHFEVNEDCLIPKNITNSIISLKPVKTPKIKKTQENIDAYRYFNEIGYNIEIQSFDNLIENGYEDDEFEFDINKLSLDELNNLLELAIKDEDYESAAELRDIINSMK
jgi:hypothetical protein